MSCTSQLSATIISVTCLLSPHFYCLGLVLIVCASVLCMCVSYLIGHRQQQLLKGSDVVCVGHPCLNKTQDEEVKLQCCVLRLNWEKTALMVKSSSLHQFLLNLIQQEHCWCFCCSFSSSWLPVYWELFHIHLCFICLWSNIKYQESAAPHHQSETKDLQLVCQFTDLYLQISQKFKTSRWKCSSRGPVFSPFDC